ncbi:aminopeptidase A [Pannonibacter phragmitetus]|uniref:leucyl aminopeptidase n=1 Tax=Pannonibacter phragmitetus TaxID=121719 RepID=UPI00067B0916|nr:leucyl aminopeptidase [Pannonibacter phragmitetus]KND16358.1 aminopeptidase A [Pannonibacter phragmitetus]
MNKLTKIQFGKASAAPAPAAVVLADDSLAAGPLAAGLLDALPGGLARAASAGGFKGKRGSKLDLVAPGGLDLDRLFVFGLGKAEDMQDTDWLKLGGSVQAALAGARAADAIVYLELPGGGEVSAKAAAQFALGAKLRSYSFDAYKTKKDEDGQPVELTINIIGPESKAAKKAFADAEAVGEGVLLARDLVNEPANVLGPVEFADRAAKLEKLGVEIEILTEKEMRKLKMAALLGVAQGSVRPPRLVIMRWNGGKKDEAPVAFVGKGVVFDTGGISIKPAAGMEDMKGDMGGAAAVTGLMHALAARKAKVNVIGIIGLVENMPDGNAQRPGDIVRAMSGTTIEILNTDAEGRLVLADALWYTQERFKPKFMIDLATLTGAVIIALGNQNAGLFSNNDELAQRLFAAGETTGESVWRLPLSKAYDKLIDTPNADVKNTGGRTAGSITAAQFLQRFVNDVPWAHLDVAGTAMGSVKDEISQGWASGFGVRLLDQLVRDHYEG